MSDDFELDRDSDGMPCECGGFMDRVYMDDGANYTDEELKRCGCGRESYGIECCIRCFVCRICKKRVVCKAPAPEME